MYTLCECCVNCLNRIVWLQERDWKLKLENEAIEMKRLQKRQMVEQWHRAQEHHQQKMLDKQEDERQRFPPHTHDTRYMIHDA